MTRRRKKTHEHANHERWVISYADFVTLLFAFFVVLFASANADRSKARAVSEAVRSALDQGKSATERAAAAREAVFEADLAKQKNEQQARVAKALVELLPSMELLKKELHAELQNGTVEMHMEPRGLAISFKQAAFFDSGSANIRGTGLPTIGKVGAALMKIPNSVRLEGHTDDLPIHTDRFDSNWDLSAARAIAVLSALTDRFGVPRRRLAIGGYADVAPIASNATEEGRARNRRVDVVILSEIGLSAEPGQSGKP